MPAHPETPHALTVTPARNGPPKGLSLWVVLGPYPGRTNALAGRFREDSGGADA